MNQHLLALYQQHRQKGSCLTSALRFARAELGSSRPALDWKDYRGHCVARWGQAGWAFVARTEVDEHYGPKDLALGEFTDTWQPGAVNHWGRTHHSDYQDHNVFRWFVPCNDYETHFRGLRNLCFGRHEADVLARSYVLRDYQRAVEMGQAWEPITVVVTVSRAGLELGSASCGGIESDCGEDYLTEMAYELAREALHEARKNARELFADFVQG